MATRCYFPETEAAAVSPTISTSDWGHIPGTPTRRRLRQRAADASTLTTTAYTPDAGDHVAVSVNAHHRQYVSDPLCAQTISGTVTGQFQTLEAHINNNLQLTVGIWLVSRDGTTLRSTLLAPVRSGTEPTAALRNTSLTSQALTSQTAVDGDRLVIEIGLGGNPTATSGTQGHNGSIRWGGTASGGDLGVDETSALTTLRPWLQFSADLAFGVTVAADSYAITGATAGLRHGVPYDPGTYALTGTDATLTPGAVGAAFDLDLDGGTYGLSGADVPLLAGPRVAAASDAYALTGSAASGLAGYRSLVAGESYTLTGALAPLLLGGRLVAGGETYALTGSDVTGRADFRVVAGADAYLLSGADVEFLAPLLGLFLASGIYDLTGSATVVTHSVPAPPGVYELTGTDATLTLGHPVAADPDSYAVSGADVGFLVGWRLVVGSDSYALTGASLEFHVPSRALVLDGGTYDLVGVDSTLGGPVVGQVTMPALAGIYQVFGDELALIPGIQFEAGEYGVAGADADFWSGPAGTRRYGDDFVILRRRRRR